MESPCQALELKVGAERVKVSYSDLPDCAAIPYPHLLTVIHGWFGAQLSEHDADAKAEQRFRYVEKRANDGLKISSRCQKRKVFPIPASRSSPASHVEIIKQIAYLAFPRKLSFDRKGSRVTDNGILTVTLRNGAAGWRITGVGVVRSIDLPSWSVIGDRHQDAYMITS